MKQFTVLLLLIMLVSCTASSEAEQALEDKAKYNEQLYVFSEAGNSESCGASSGDSILFGGLLLTDKGNIIVNFQTTREDSTHCFYGKYTYVGKNISYTLSNVYSFKGNWSPNEQDIASGISRNITAINDTLYATHCANENGYYRTFSGAEEHLYGIRGAHRTPNALYYMPYKETVQMKFFTWFFRQVPALKDL